MRFPCIGAAALLWIVAAPAPAGAGTVERRAPGFVVQARRIYTSAAEEGLPAVLEGGMIRVRRGKVEAVGRDLEVPEGWPLYRYPNGVIVPALVAADTLLVPSAGGPKSLSAAYRAADGFDPYGDYRQVLAGGVTTAFLDAGTRRLLSGTGAVVKLAGPEGPGYVLEEEGALCITLGEESFNPPGFQEYPLPASSLEPIEPAERQYPRSRLGQYAALREAFARARAWKGGGDGPFDFHAETLSRALAKGLRLRIRALYARDLEGGLRLLRELECTGYLEGAAEAHRVVDALERAALPVVLEVPLSLNRPAKDRKPGEEPPEARLDTAARLYRAGVPFALVLPFSERVGDLMLAAAAAVRGGLDPEAALLAVTRRPAEILGVADRVGSLAPGKDADFLVLNGRPLAAATHVRRVYVEGREVFRRPGIGEALVVRAGSILTAAGPPLEPGELLVEHGKITAVGRTVPHPPGACILEAGPRAVVTPGFIDGYSHLGLAGDGSRAGTEIRLADALAVPGPAFRAVASAGITTVLISPRGSASRGTLVSAVKTWWPHREALRVKAAAAIRFSVRGKDPKAATAEMERALKAGKAYAEKWKKYFEALKKWEEARAKGAGEGGKGGKDGKKAGKAEETGAKTGKGGPPGDGEEEKAPEKETPDPVTGTWEYEVTGGPMPEPVKGTLELELEEGGRITGTGSTFFRRRGGREVAVEGTLQGSAVHLEFDVQTPAGKPTVDAELDAEDHMTGKFRLGQYMELDFSARRTKKAAPVIHVTSRRRRKAEGGKPVPPEENPALEPFRALFDGEAAVVVEADTVPEMEAAVRLVADTYELPVVIAGGRDAVDMADRLKKAGAAVLLPPEIVTRRKGRPFVPADALARAGVPVIFGSRAEDGARALPWNAAYAVHRGMDPSAALEALTCTPARFFRMDRRVGALAAGRDGDFIVFSGNPFEPTSRVLHVFVNGKEVKP